MNNEEEAAILRLENKVQELTTLVSSLIDHFHVGKKPPDLDNIERLVDLKIAKINQRKRRALA